MYSILIKKITFFSITFLFLLSVSCKHKEAEKEETGIFKTTSPLKLDTSYTKDYVAQIQAVRNIELRAQEKGYLQDVYIDEGQYVHEGQLLFRIMPKLYEAEVLKAQAEVKQSELELLNTKTLADKNIVSKTELAIAQAKLDQAKAELALAQLHLSLTEIKAPFDGIIDRIRFKKGSLIDEDGLLTTLSSTKFVFAYFNVTELEYLDFKNRKTDQNQKVTLILANGQEHKFTGEIETIEAEFNNETGNIAFRAKFPNPDLLLKHGETGKVRLTIPLKDALIIPQKATYDLQDKVYVYVVDNENKIKSRNIIVKQALSNLYILDRGLNENDKILVEGLQTAREDEEIKAEFVEPKDIIYNLQLIK
ncbi:MAG: efflux RND transporter periplasmic adaptor subunit [Saprospiraceae bacterium]